MIPTRIVLLIFGAASAILLTGCSPKITLIDRHTVLEDEAAGEWPDFEKRMLDDLRTKKPTAYRKIEVNESRAKLFNVFNGEMVTESQVASKPKGE